MSDLVIDKSKIHGLGIFANKDFKPNEEILKLKGNPKEIIYSNHSCIPNAFFLQPDKADMQTHALYSRGIRKGEEITCDYRIGTLYHDLWEKTMKGRCTCPKCRT